MRGGATLANLAAGDLHPSLPPADAFTAIHAFQVPPALLPGLLVLLPPCHVTNDLRSNIEFASPCIGNKRFGIDTR